MSYLKLHQLSLSFREHHIFKEVCLEVNEGEIVVIFGHSGCGKTTLLRAIAGLQELDGGSIHFDQQDITFIAPEKRKIGMAFQNFALYPHQSAFQNIASPLIAQKLETSQIEKQVFQIAEHFKVKHVLNHLPKALSNGQKQRVSLARALIAAPKLLLLDDPLRNVDAKLRFEMRLSLPELLREFQSTTIHVTQDYKEAMALADRIAILHEGEIIQFETPETIYLKPASLTVAKLFGDPPINLIHVSPKNIESLPFDQEQMDQLMKQQKLELDSYILGIRPEYLNFCQSHEQGAFQVRVLAITPLNERNIVFLKTEHGHELLSSHPFDETLPCVGEKQSMRFDSENIFLFDPQNQMRINLKQ